MKTIKNKIEEVFAKLKYERFLLSINTRIIVLNIVSAYTLLTTFFDNTSPTLFVLSICVSGIMFFMTTKFKKFYDESKKEYFLFMFYFVEIMLLTLTIKFTTVYDILPFHQLNILYLFSIILSSFHDKKRIVMFTTILSCVSKAFLFFSGMSIDTYSFILKEGKPHEYLYWTDLLLNSLMTGAFGWVVLQTVESATKTFRIISAVSFKEVFDTNMEKVSFSNKEKVFLNSIKITAENKQSEYLGGGDFISIEEKDDYVYGIIGDISSHGANMISGSFLASALFKTYVNTHINPKTSDILNYVSNGISILSEDIGGRGVAISFRINKKGEVYYCGFIFKNAMKKNNKSLPLTSPIRLGEKADYFVKSELKTQLEKEDEIVILTDGWGSEGNFSDDATKLTIKRIK